LLKLPCEPFPSVDVNLNGKREPYGRSQLCKRTCMKPNAGS
jgi:hypothetical protein